MADGVDVKYKLISYNIIDTLTIGEAIDSFSLNLPIIEKENIEDFKKLRNQEFQDFRDPGYEEDVMHGKLKDASEWCTEIREITEKSDSIISVWDKVTKYSYDYNYLHWWYLRRAAEYYEYDYELRSNINQAFDLVVQSKKQFEDINKLLSFNPQDKYGYIVIHKYSIHNPFVNNRIEIVNKVYLDNDMNYIKHETMSDLGDFMKQIIKK